MKFKIFIPMILTLVILSSPVLAQLSIVIPVGTPKIESLGYSREGFDDYLVANIKNIGNERGSFSYTFQSEKCTVYGGTSVFQLDPNQAKDLKIKISCTYGSASLTFRVYDTAGFKEDVQTITFDVKKPSYCGTTYASCEEGRKRCSSDNTKVEICNQYCDDYATYQLCGSGERCEWIWKGGVSDFKCINIQEYEREQALESYKNWSIIISIFAIPILAIVGLWYYFKKRKKKK